MSKAPRENRVPIMMTDDELAAIENWRFANHIATLSGAIRCLSVIGLMNQASAENVAKTIARLRRTPRPSNATRKE